MKKYFLFICIFFVATEANAEQYVIERMNGDYITYMGKKLTKYDVFEFPDSIVWDNSTAIIVRNKRTGNTTRFRETDFLPKKDFSLWKYFVKINHGSSRICEDYCLCSILDNVFVLEDTIRVRTDNPDIIDIYQGNLSKSELPQYFLSYNYEGRLYTVALASEEDEFIIPKSAFAHISPSQSLMVSIFAIDNKGNKSIVSDSMVIKIL